MLLTIIVSSLLSITSKNLSLIQKNNKDIDQKRNILESIGLNISKLNSENIIEEYNNRIRNVVLDINGNIVDDIKF
ncbi:uncharacterized protein METZ01_LOCUS412767, partial [marine metagenome]